MNENGLTDCLVELVAAIGKEDFAQCFLAVFEKIANVQLCSVFSVGPGQLVKLLFAQGKHPELADFSSQASLVYASRFWRSDSQMSRLFHSGVQRPIIVRRRAVDIADPAYRATCYERGDIRERLSIFWPGSPVLFANGYRVGSRAAFSTETIEQVEEQAPLLMAAVESHLRNSHLAGRMLNETELMQSLRAMVPSLSIREAEISVAMMLGETQTEIAERKRLSSNSVITYRRRAYSKLGLVNRRDLMRLHRHMAFEGRL
ncbi:helix-turn-helix transcriptional regulator [Parasphingorhabdus sp.]|uniref:helix-turn-helix transcriptional regulator n=1 Tax=Parasphingorhabdus sp. TaxID=2709688 RepID=UPI003A914459